MTDCVVLAANSHPDYSFLLPITQAVWRCRTLYVPLSVPSHGIQRDRMAIKLSRWYSWRYANPDDTLLLTDVDLWPIDGAFFNRPSARRVTLFYADAFQYKRHTTLNARFRADALKEITEGKTWQERLEEIRKRPDDWEGRHSDDCAQSELLMAWKGYPDECEMVERGPSPPATRIDRSRWPETFDITGMVDAHLPRDASDGRVWRKILPLFDLLCPSHSKWVREYRDRWEREYE